MTRAVPTEDGGRAAEMEAPDVRRTIPGEEAVLRVRVRSGGLDELAGVCRRHAPAHRYAIVADAAVAELHGDRALDLLRDADLEVEIFTFPPGERSKTREMWSRLSDGLLEAGYGRDSSVVALGGGVTGDLAGFVAATYMRGVPVVQVPTTLLAMVDSSVGGKTAVDTPGGKNLLGAFHHPAFVLIDPDLLSTLPREERASGLAEAVKTAAIADEELFARMEQWGGALLEDVAERDERLIRRCVAIKAGIVADDPRERGRRAVLNFGHTIGHALELLAEYALPHGAAVAAGMRVEASLGEAMGVTRPGTARRLAAVLDGCGHVGRPEREFAPAGLVRAAALDKKGREGDPRLVLLDRPGHVAPDENGRPTHRLSGGTLKDLLAKVLEDGDSMLGEA